MGTQSPEPHGLCSYPLLSLWLLGPASEHFHDGQADLPCLGELGPVPPLGCVSQALLCTKKLGTHWEREGLGAPVREMGRD